jgi:hypothetical protein
LRHTSGQLCFFILVGAWILFPAFQNFGEVISGAPISDLWNALWSLDFAHLSILQGQSPQCTVLLNYPRGGCLWPSDILGALISLPFSFFFSITEQYTILVFIQLILAGSATALFLDEISEEANPWAGCLAGFIVMDSTPMRIAIHNGSSEALSIGFVILAFWGLLRFQRGSKWGLVPLLLSIFSSWYGVFLVLGFLGIQILWKRTLLKENLLVLGVYALCLLPYAYFVKSVSTAKGNLLNIKGSAELDMVRRMIGSMDPLTYILPRPYISPDFSLVSRAGEQFVHSGYLGWTLIISALWSWRRIAQKQSLHPLLAWGTLFLILSLGPVLLQGGEPIIFGDLVIPLPYALIEQFWGFSQLSLLFRWGVAPLFVLAIAVSLCFSGTGSRRGLLILGLLVFFENRILSPVHSLPAFTPIPVSEPFEELRDAEEGAVGTLPIVEGREALYLQTIHGKPMLAGLNFALNRRFRQFLEQAKRMQERDDFSKKIEVLARQKKIRYLIINKDHSIMPDQYFALKEKFQKEFTVLSESNEYIVLTLY